MSAPRNARRNAQRRGRTAMREAHTAELARVERLTPLESLDYLIDAAEANVRAVLEEHEEQRPRMGS